MNKTILDIEITKGKCAFSYLPLLFLTFLCSTILNFKSFTSSSPSSNIHPPSSSSSFSSYSSSYSSNSSCKPQSYYPPSSYLI